MKTTLFGLVFLGLTHLISAQNELAMETSTHKIKTYKSSKVEIHNAQYLKADRQTTASFAANMKTLQQLAANYNIKKDPVYSKNKSVTYTVHFQSKANTITAIYDYKGLILRSEEHYTDVRIPYQLSVKLAKDYPGWAFYKSTCQLNYDQSEGTARRYTVQLKKDDLIKTVSLPLTS